MLPEPIQPILEQAPTEPRTLAEARVRQLRNPPVLPSLGRTGARLMCGSQITHIRTTLSVEPPSPRLLFTTLFLTQFILLTIPVLALESAAERSHNLTVLRDLFLTTEALSGFVSVNRAPKFPAYGCKVMRILLAVRVV